MVLALSAESADPTRPPNIVLILADDLGYGDVGCYNADSQIPTPHIDRLAREGTRFTDAHAAASVCVPTRYSLLTGRYAHRRPRRNGSFDGGPLIDNGTLTLPGVLRQAGYRTAMIGKWHLGFAYDDFASPLGGGPVDQGFNAFFGVPASTDIPPYFFIEGNQVVVAPTEPIEEHHSPGVQPIQGAFWRSGTIGRGMTLEAVLPTFTEKALTILDEHARSPGKPLFLYVALTAPHTPWLPSAPFRGRSFTARDDVPQALQDYGDFVVQVDDIVGRLLARLDEHDLAEETLVIFTSDNGPTWYDADVERTGHDSAGPWRGMKGDVWEAGHRVPFLVRWPGRVPAARTSAALIGQVDLLATLAALADQPLPPEAAPDSENLLPLLLGAAEARGRETLLTQSSAGVLALRKGHWKYIPHLGSAGFSTPKNERPAPQGPTAQLYDLATDPGETSNLAGELPEVTADMALLLERLQKAERTTPQIVR